MIAPGPCLTACLPGIHKRGGTILGTSRGGFNLRKICDAIQDRGINQVKLYDADMMRAQCGPITNDLIGPLSLK